MREYEVAESVAAPFNIGRKLLVALVVLETSLVPARHDFGNDELAATLVAHAVRPGETHGFVLYRMLAVAELERHQVLDDGTHSDNLDMWHSVRQLRVQGGATLQQTLDSWRHYATRNVPVAVEICPQQVAAMVRMGRSVLDVVPFGAHIQRARLLGAFPSCEQLTVFRATHADRLFLAKRSHAEIGQRSFDGAQRVPIDLMLKWATATQYIRMLKQGHVAANAFANIILPGRSAADAAMNRLHKVST